MKAADDFKTSAAIAKPTAWNRVWAWAVSI